MSLFAPPILYFPQSRATLLGFAKLVALRNSVRTHRAVTIDFSKCNSIAQHSVAFLGAWIRLLESQGKKAHIDWSSCKKRVLRQLNRNGFASVFGGPPGPIKVDEHVVRYREDAQDSGSIVGYLKDHWLGHDWIHISDPLRNRIVGRTIEIYANAFEHSGSPIGVTTCGHHSDIKKELSLTVVDFGNGIPTNVRKYLSDDTIPSWRALWWAFQRGTTTNPRIDFSRGMGFDLLQEFVKVNQGSIEVYSGDAYAKVSSGGQEFVDLDFDVSGTIVHIVFKCDERHYMLASETKGQQGRLF